MANSTIGFKASTGETGRTPTILASDQPKHAQQSEAASDKLALVAYTFKDCEVEDAGHKSSPLMVCAARSTKVLWQHAHVTINLPRKGSASASPAVKCRYVKEFVSTAPHHAIRPARSCHIRQLDYSIGCQDRCRENLDVGLCQQSWSCVLVVEKIAKQESASRRAVTGPCLSGAVRTLAHQDVVTPGHNLVTAVTFTTAVEQITAVCGSRTARLLRLRTLAETPILRV